MWRCLSTWFTSNRYSDLSQLYNRHHWYNTQCLVCCHSYGLSCFFVFKESICSVSRWKISRVHPVQLHWVLFLCSFLFMLLHHQRVQRHLKSLASYRNNLVQSLVWVKPFFSKSLQWIIVLHLLLFLIFQHFHFPVWWKEVLRHITHRCTIRTWHGHQLVHSWAIKWCVLWHSIGIDFIWVTWRMKDIYLVFSTGSQSAESCFKFYVSDKAICTCPGDPCLTTTTSTTSTSAYVRNILFFVVVFHVRIYFFRTTTTRLINFHQDKICSL